MSTFTSTRKSELVLADHPATRIPPHRTVRRIGRVRIPLAGPYRPWATLYRFPDGRLLWCVRLWNVDHVESRCISTDVLHRFATQNRLGALRAAIDALVDAAAPQRR